ncbi:MAG: methylated-DNA--[protein]-cysteine S-methyltransferase, partial [Rhodospirillaceae bacterium]|nr:methylated-DNA--[protein]-cysteine S-methyltransferase [Rhodospirillaceae bacterium]
EENGALTSLAWGKNNEGTSAPTPLLAQAIHQLQDYFAGKRQSFDLPLNPTGTAFQKKVWENLSAIPYGETRRYGDVARAIKSAPRAVGMGCGQNPLPILIPCHRVVASDGTLGGYSGGEGLETKAGLLDLEQHRL